MFKAIILGIVTGMTIVFIAHFNNTTENIAPVIYGNTNVVTVQAGEEWTQPWAPMPSHIDWSKND